MTDSQKLDLLLEKVTIMQGDIADMKPLVRNLEKDVKVIQLDIENDLRISIKRVAEARDIYNRLSKCAPA